MAGSTSLPSPGLLHRSARLPIFMEGHIRIIMDAHICCFMDRHIRITMDAHIYVAGLMTICRTSYSVRYVFVSAGIIGSVAAAVGGVGAIVTSGDAAAAGPDEGRGGLGGRRRVDGDCGAVLSGAVAFGNEKLTLRNWL